jgi:hypothetical protein
MLDYFAGDERPYWETTVTIDGAADDMTTGYTFEVALAATPTSTPVLSKTTGITGGADGVVTTAWAVVDLDVPPGRYVAHLTATRTADSLQWTVDEVVNIKRRLTT